MDAAKPLVFIHPLSPSLQKLRDVIAETSEENDIEIFDVEDPIEISQLAPTLGQCLIISSTPKKCAMILQSNRKVIQKLNSKVILLSPKQIPRKTLEKFTKVGLTDCIVEPVAPKTLLYKVNLLLKSIAKKQSGSGDFDAKTLKSNNEEEDFTNETQRVEKTVALEANSEEGFYKRKSKDNFSNLGSGHLKNDSSGSAEEISGVEKGKIDTEANIYDHSESGHQKGKNNFQEDDLGAYYKGKLDELQNKELEDENMSGRSSFQEEVGGSNKSGETGVDEIDDKLASKSKGFTENFSDEEASLLNPTKDLEIDEIEKERQRLQKEMDDMIEGERKKDKPLELDEEDDSNPLYRRDDDDEEKGQINNRVNPEFAEEEKKGKDYHLDDEEEDSPLGKRKKQAEAEEEEKEKKKAQLSEEEEKEKKDPNEGQVDHLDKFYKGDLESTEKEKDAKQKGDVAQADLDVFDDEDHERRKRRKDFDESGEEDKSRKKEEDLHLDEKGKKRKKTAQTEEDDDFMKSRSLDPQAQADKKNRERQDQEQGDDSLGKRRKNNYQDVEGAGLNSHDSQVEDLGDDLKKGSFTKSDKEVDKKKKTDTQREHIEKYMKSGESIMHQEEHSWEGLSNKKIEEEIEDKEKKLEEFATFLGKESLGEQTIDYGKLYDEFGGITITRSAPKDKESSGWDDEEVKAQKKYGPKYYRPEDFGDDSLKEAESKKEDNEDGLLVFQATPNGLDHAVLIQAQYENEKIESTDIFTYVGETILHEEAGQVTFFLKDPGTGKTNVIYSNDKDFESDFWDIKRQNMMDEASTVTVPNLSDPTFQEDSIVFIYPFYEGLTFMGFAYVTFDSGLTEQRSHKCEVVLECTRGLFLEVYNQGKSLVKSKMSTPAKQTTGTRGNYLTQEDDEEMPEQKPGKVKSFFGKLFKRSA